MTTTTIPRVYLAQVSYPGTGQLPGNRADDRIADAARKGCIGMQAAILDATAAIRELQSDLVIQRGILQRLCAEYIGVEVTAIAWGHQPEDIGRILVSPDSTFQRNAAERLWVSIGRGQVAAVTCKRTKPREKKQVGEPR